MKRISWAAVLVALVAALALSGCGSSDSSDTSAGSDKGASGGLSGDPIKIGLVCSCSGAFAGSLGALPDVADVWTKYINDKGGVNGHPVKVIVADDGADATKSQQLVRKLVEQDKVLAIVDETASFDATWADYVAKAGVPVTGGVSFTQPMTTNADFFPAGGTLASVTYGLVKNAQDAKTTKMAVLPCAEAPLCDGYVGEITRISDAVGAGVDVVYNSKISASATSYTSQCLAAKKAGANAMYVGHGGEIVERVVNECVLQGYTPKQLQVGGDVVSSWVKNKNMDGVPTAQFHLPVHDTTTVGGKAFNDAIAKYDSKLPSGSAWSDNTIETWTGLQLFAEAAEKAGVGPTSTTDDVKKGLYALSGTTLDGLTPPLSYQKGKATVINCYFNESVEDGKWTTPGGTDPVCLDDATAAKVNAAFAG